jgi:hypothetical protein
MAPYTVFVPTDAAIKPHLKKDKEALKDMFQLLVVPGRGVASKEKLAEDSLPTVGGELVVVKGDVVTLEDGGTTAKIVGGPHKASNGVVYEIDGMLSSDPGSESGMTTKNEDTEEEAEQPKPAPSKAPKEAKSTSSVPSSPPPSGDPLEADVVAEEEKYSGPVGGLVSSVLSKQGKTPGAKPGAHVHRPDPGVSQLNNSVKVLAGAVKDLTTQLKHRAINQSVEEQVIDIDAFTDTDHGDAVVMLPKVTLK